MVLKCNSSIKSQILYFNRLKAFFNLCFCLHFAFDILDTHLSANLQSLAILEKSPSPILKTQFSEKPVMKVLMPGSRETIFPWLSETMGFTLYGTITNHLPCSQISRESLKS